MKVPKAVAPTPIAEVRLPTATAPRPLAVATVPTAVLRSEVVSDGKMLLDVIELVQAPIVEDSSASGDDGGFEFRESIIFDRVSLSYPERPNALRDVTFRIDKGDRLGIMGPSGSGKSSLLDLLMGLLQPSAGEIRIDGRLLTDRNRAHWQRHLAHVPQSVYLPDSSIAACIAFGDRGSS